MNTKSKVTEVRRPTTELLVEEKFALAGDFCKKVIKKFENSSSKQQGLIGRGKVDETVKCSTDLHLSSEEGWSEEDKVFHASLAKALEKYMVRVNSCGCFYVNLYDSGYQIQCTEPFGGYGWHNDFQAEGNGCFRICTYIWYLNTVKGGGGTEFADGRIIKPVEGTLLLFPATWTFAHRGLPPKKGKKYICTGWIYGSHPS